MTPEQIANLVMDEDEAFMVVHVLEERFGWAGTFFTRRDAETQWDGLSEQPFTDQMWDELRNSREWRRTVPSAMTEDGWESVAHAVSCLHTQLESEMEQESL